MFHRQESVGSESDDRSSEAPAIDLDRLRAALRLATDGTAADRIVASIGAGSIDSTIKRVLRAVTWDRRLRLLRRRTPPETERPLGPESRATTRGAVALALHLGLRLPLDPIVRAVSTSPEQLGTELYQTRLLLEPSTTPACGEFIASIGRYRDGSLDLAARATLIQHAQHCPACRAALDRFQTLDARLLEQVERERAALPPLPEPAATGRFRQLRQPLAVGAIALLVVLLGIGAFRTFVHRGQVEAGTEVAPTLSGWVLTTDASGSLTALNLADGLQRPLGNAAERQLQPGFVASSTVVSPNRQLIASQIGRYSQYSAQTIVIEDLTGAVLTTIRLADQYARLAGWLGNDTVLEITYPPQETGESADDYFTRAQTHQSLIGIDIASGEKRELYRGAVTAVYPAPDGSQIAIVLSYTQSNGGLQTIELRPITNGQLGSSITSVSKRIAGSPTLTISLPLESQVLWAPDSSRFYAAIADAPSQAATPATGAPSPTAATEPLPLVSVARDGTITTVPQPPAHFLNLPIDISPDGQRLIIESLDPSVDRTTEVPRTRVWEVNLRDGSLRPLTDWSPSWTYSGVWSPDGTTALLPQWRPFMLSPAGPMTPDIAQVTTLFAVPRNGDGHIALSRMNTELDSKFIAWLPADALPAPITGGTPVRLSQPETLTLEPSDLRIETSAQASDNDDYLLAHDPTANRPVIWDRAGQSGRDLPPGTHDLSWFPHTSVLIGVNAAEAGGRQDPSRIATYAPAFSVQLPSYDYRAYDPAQIGDSLDKRYASPLMSPNENTLAFFVIDTRGGSVTLWLADYSAPPRPVAHWYLPNDSKLAYSPIAGWIDDQTLLFAEPGDWQNGVPGKVKLQRLTLQTDDRVDISTATTLKRHGTERGIAVAELAVNQTSGHIAYRLRHFTKNSTNDGIIDTISITSATKLGDPLEIARGGSSSGLSWSPEGRLLAATTPDDLAFYSASGEAVLGLSELDFPNEPTWVDQDTVWFNVSNDHGTRILSVDLQ